MADKTIIDYDSVISIDNQNDYMLMYQNSTGDYGKVNRNTLLGSDVGVLNTYGSSNLKSFRAAMALKSTYPVDIVFIGDSKTEGIGVVSVYDTWIQKFIAKYRQYNQPDGVRGGFGYMPAVYLAGWPSFVLSGTATALTNQSTDIAGLGKRAVSMTGAGSMVMTLGGGLFGTPSSLEIVYTQGAAYGSFSYHINANAPVTVNCNGAEVVGKRVSVGTGQIYNDRNNNTLTIDWVSGSVNIEGVMIYDGDEAAGVRVWEAGHSGANVSAYNTTDKCFDDLTSIQPALVYYSMGRNDYANNSPIATIVAGIKGHIATIRSKVTQTPSIIFGMDWEDDAGTPTQTYANFYAAMAQICREDGDIAFFDNYKIFGKMQDAGDDINGLTIDYIHLSDKGQEVMADAFMTFILNSVETSGYSELGSPTFPLTGADLDTVPHQNIQFAYGNACTNAPGGTADGYFTQTIHQRLAGYRIQTFTNYITGVTYLRSMINSVWGSWNERLLATGSMTQLTNSYMARAYLNGNVTNIPDATPALLVLNAETYDLNSNFSTVTGLYTTPVAGYYQITLSAGLFGTNMAYPQVRLYVDGFDMVHGSSINTAVGEFTSTATDTIYIAAGKTVGLYIFGDVSAGDVSVVGASTVTYMDIRLVSL